MGKLDKYVKSADWKNEKHVPAIEVPESITSGEAFNATVSVGKAIPHPNTTEHHIVWIALHFVPEGESRSYEITRCEFSSHGQSAAGPDKGAAYTGSTITLPITLTSPGTLFATSYCNIHGLWDSSCAIAFS